MGEGTSGEEQKFNSLNFTARNIHGALRRDKKSKKAWEDLRNFTYVEHDSQGKPLSEEESQLARDRRMESLRNQLPDHAWLALTKRLSDIHLDDEEVPDMYGDKIDGTGVFLELASDLKEFDEVAFTGEIKLASDGDKKWREFIKPFLESIQDDPFLFLTAASDAKILFPDKFASGEFVIKNQAWETIENALKENEEDTILFLEYYKYAAFLDKKEIQRRLPISEIRWKNIIEFVSSIENQGIEHGKAASFAQAIRPESYPRIKVPYDYWEYYIHDFKSIAKNTTNYWQLLKTTKDLKYLELEPKTP